MICIEVPKCLRIVGMVRDRFKMWRNLTLGEPPSHTCCRGNLRSRWPLCVCLQVCPVPALHPVPVSATPFYDRVVPEVSSLAPVDGLLPSALVSRGVETMVMMMVREEEDDRARCGKQCGPKKRMNLQKIIWGWRERKL